MAKRLWYYLLIPLRDSVPVHLYNDAKEPIFVFSIHNFHHIYKNDLAHNINEVVMLKIVGGVIPAFLEWGATRIS